MNWQTNKVRTKVGDKRRRTIFAWWPINCENGRTYWLTRVRVHEEFQSWLVASHDVRTGWRRTWARGWR